MSLPKKKLGVLISGRGSNLTALIEACAQPDYPAQINVVISNRPNAPGLKIAKNAGLFTKVIDHKAFSDRRQFDAELSGALRIEQCDLICNAGFMRLLTPEFVKQWNGRQINIHPSLLPAFKGLHTHERVIQAGVRISGCTVHFVSAEMDAGAIIAQAAVPVLPNDTPKQLAARVLAAEHKLYPHALFLVASGQAQLKGDQVIFSSAAEKNGNTDSFFVPPLAESHGVL